MQLGTNILKDDDTVEQLRIGISRAQSMELSVDDPDMISNLANLYRSSISQVSPRIMVSGDPDYLNDNNIASTIRASLLGGLRSVVLWRQCGGSRPKLILSRSQYLKHAESYLTR
ncbi:MAG: high frequency lysogenization protein [Granulosicoccus sp.]